VLSEQIPKVAKGLEFGLEEATKKSLLLFAKTSDFQPAGGHFNYCSIVDTIELKPAGTRKAPKFRMTFSRVSGTRSPEMAGRIRFSAAIGRL